MTTQGEDTLQWVCGAEPDIMEGSRDIQVQDSKGWSVPLVTRTDQKGVPEHLSSPPASLNSYFKHCPLTPVYECFSSVPISFLLLVLVPVLGEEPALPQPLFLPRNWQNPEQGCLGTLVCEKAAAWLGPDSGEL